MLLAIMAVLNVTQWIFLFSTCLAGIYGSFWRVEVPLGVEGASCSQESFEKV